MRGTLNPNSQDNQNAKHHFKKKKQEKSQVVQIVWNKTQSHVSACRKNSSTYETMESWDLIVSGPQKIHKMTPQERHAQLRNQWYTVQTTARGSNTIPTRQHPELGQVGRVRMNHDSTQWVIASQAGSSRSHPQYMQRLFLSSERCQESCDLSRGCRTTHSLCPYLNTAPLLSVSRTTSSADSCVAASLSVFQFEVVLKSTLVVDHDTTVHGVHADTVAFSLSVLIKCSFCSYHQSLTRTPHQWLKKTIHRTWRQTVIFYHHGSVTLVHGACFVTWRLGAQSLVIVARLLLLWWCSVGLVSLAEEKLRGP